MHQKNAMLVVKDKTPKGMLRAMLGTFNSILLNVAQIIDISTNAPNITKNRPDSTKLIFVTVAL